MVILAPKIIINKHAVTDWCLGQALELQVVATIKCPCSLCSRIVSFDRLLRGTVAVIHCDKSTRVKGNIYR